MASPYQNSVEVAHLQVQPLILSTGQTKTHGEEHQGERDHPRKHEAHRPHIKPETEREHVNLARFISWTEIISLYTRLKRRTFSDGPHR